MNIKSQTEVILRIKIWFNIQQKNQCNYFWEQKKEEKVHNYINRCKNFNVIIH